MLPESYYYQCKLQDLQARYSSLRAARLAEVKDESLEVMSTVARNFDTAHHTLRNITLSLLSQTQRREALEERQLMVSGDRAMSIHVMQ